MSTIRKLIAGAVVAGALALSAVAGAAAFHPGVNDNPDHELPQGPKVVACENQGGEENPSGEGVFTAIDAGGNVHCSPFSD
ncbi:MAG: hypothetical protein WD379_05450 [Dehalococcoidia bacterium]